jgi:hypothetical protein
MLLFLVTSLATTCIARYASGTSYQELSNSLVSSWKPASTTVAFEDVQIVNNIAYITDFQLPGLRVVSLADPASPSQLGQAYTTGGVYDLIVKNNIAFTRVGPNHIECFNIATPASPFATGNFLTYTGVSDFDVSGTKLCLGNGSDLVLLDITTLGAPVELDRLTLGGSLSVKIEGNFIFACVTVSGTAHYFKIINATVPGSLVEIASVALGGYYIDSMLISGTTLYTSGRDYALAQPTGGTVKTFDVSNKTAPVKIGEITTGGISSVGVMLLENNLYTGACAQGLVIINASNPASLQPVGFYNEYQSTCGGESYALHPQSLVDATRGKLVVFVSMACGLNIIAFNGFDFPSSTDTITIIIIVVAIGGIGGGLAIILGLLKARKH